MSKLIRADKFNDTKVLLKECEKNQAYSIDVINKTEKHYLNLNNCNEEKAISIMEKSIKILKKEQNQSFHDILNTIKNIIKTESLNL